MEGGTAVTGSPYLFDMQVQRFFATLPPAPEAPAVPEPAMEGATMEGATAAGGAGAA